MCMLAAVILSFRYIVLPYIILSTDILIRNYGEWLLYKFNKQNQIKRPFLRMFNNFIDNKFLLNFLLITFQTADSCNRVCC